MRYLRAIGTRLLERLRLDIGLAGDLLEERESGRSAIWYWKQVLAAVAVSIWGGIRAHKVLMLGAVMTGVGAETIMWGLYNAFISEQLPRGPMTAFTPWTINLLTIFVTQAAIGWLISRTQRVHAMLSLLTFLTFSFIWWMYQSVSLISRLAVDSIDQPRFRIYLFYHLSNILVAMLSLVLGGLLSASPKLGMEEEPAEH